MITKKERKGSRLTTAIVAVTLSFSAVSIVDAALITHYEFENDLTNTVVTGPDGTGVGSPAYGIGKVGSNALKLDGSSYITTTTGGHPNSTSGLPLGSVAFWINTSQTTSFAVSGAFNDGSSTGWVIQGNQTQDPGDLQQDESLRMYLRDNSPTVHIGWSDAAGDWNDGAWHHIAVTWDAKTSGGDADFDMQFYVDGSAVTTGTTAETNVLDDLTAWGYPVMIGANNARGTAATPLTGQLDDYRVYDHELTSGEVTALIPEPSSISLLGLALGVVLMRRRRS